MMTEMVTINFADLTSKGRISNLSGRHRGLAARESYKLNWHSADDIKQINIIVPQSVDSVTPSFVQGLFGSVMNVFGLNEEKFFSHVNIQATPLIIDQLRYGIRALRTRNNLNNLG